MSSCFFGVLFLLINAVQAIGAAKASLLLNASRQGLFFIPILLVLHSVFGLYGLVYAQPIADLLTLVVAVLLYRSVSRRMLTSDSVVENSGSEDSVLVLTEG